MGDPCANSKVQALCEPNRDRECYRSGAPGDQTEPPCRDRRNKRTGLARLSAAPSSNAPADARLRPTESRFATRLNRVLQHNRAKSGHREVAVALPRCAKRRHRAVSHSITSSASMAAGKALMAAVLEYDLDGIVA